ncbi:hypothetical protein [Arthrobacter sp. FW306-2-2C-D06B]|uniref:hypothetical protein n=1 Tax=Arthrobacter sp. FW306-2-2C-D06B TaxID=2879618 RepID=UPI001F25AAF5|nr:hypothetical protein [Arthrobacter sp. FW306-2-2C-D06B]UKA58622.1 hypothetical protein LFT47_20535 [Arthrobacter sp. FW306-2-2C-D06B]
MESRVPNSPGVHLVHLVPRISPDAAPERAAQGNWNWMRATVRPVRGTVASRNVGLSEDGGVSSFALTIRTGEPGIASFEAGWKPPAGSPDLLQSQVPGIGAEARVWVPGQSQTGQPLFVVEVVDPTVALDRQP